MVSIGSFSHCTYKCVIEHCAPRGQRGGARSERVERNTAEFDGAHAKDAAKRLVTLYHYSYPASGTLVIRVQSGIRRPGPITPFLAPRGEYLELYCQRLPSPARGTERRESLGFILFSRRASVSRNPHPGPKIFSGPQMRLAPRVLPKEWRQLRAYTLAQ